MKRRWWIVLAVVGVVVVAIVAAGLVGAARRRATLEGLQATPAARGELTSLVGATGMVRANQSAILTFQTTGVVEQVNVSLGERVRPDQVLASLELTSLSPQVILAQADLVAAQRALADLLQSDVARTQAQSAVAEARDALDLAEYRWRTQQQGYRASNSTISGARANVILAESEVDVAQNSYNQVSNYPEDSPVRALALSQLTSAQARRDSAQRTLDWYLGRPNDIDQAVLDANVALAEARLADAEREWERLMDGPDPGDIAAAEARVASAQASVDLARIAAPFAGTITSIEVMPGDEVAPGTIAFGLDDLSHQLVDVEVSEVDINHVQVGQPVSLTFDAAEGKEYAGVVTEVALVGKMSQGVVIFPVSVEVLEVDEAVRPGMTAAVNIVVEQLSDVLLIPNRAVRVRDGQRVVYVLRNGLPETVPVVLGASSDLYSQLLDGEINVGDAIVLNPPAGLEALQGSAGGPPAFVR
jgi:HlyD family secretion protein